MSDDPAVLAQRFAHALTQLQSAWDLQYVGAGPMPPSTEADGTDASCTPDVVAATSADEPESSQSAADGGEPARGDELAAEATEPAVHDESAGQGESSLAAEPAGPAEHEERSAPAGQAAPASTGGASAASPEPPTRQPEGHPPSPTPAASNQAGSAASSPERTPAPAITDPQQRAAAAAARKEALREQAQRWSPATKLEYLRRHNVGDCRRCPLARTRNNIVFGVGSPTADVMFIGEAPGANEDRQGEPFVGRAGQLLDRWLVELGMARADVYIANVLKCRPPGNRDPRPEEVDRCSPFLQAQIRAIEPKVIVALGRHAGMLLSRREDMTLRAMRSTTRLRYDAGAPKSDPRSRIQIPLVVTYHPAYVLRQEGDGRQLPPGRPSPTAMVMTDLRRALSIAGIAASPGPSAPSGPRG